MTNVIELAKQAGLLVIGTADGCDAVYTWPRGITSELELFAKLVRNASLEEAAKVLRDVDALHAAGLVDATIDAIRNLKESTP